MKHLQDRNRIVLGAIGIVVIALAALVALNFNSIPFFNAGIPYSAYFAEAGGLTNSAPVQVSGLTVGEVRSVTLDRKGVLVKFTVDGSVRLGERTRATVKTQTLLGNKVLEVEPLGPGRMRGTIPIERTTAPYELPDALGDLTATISGIDTDQLSNSLRTLSQTLQDTPPQLKVAVDGVARFSKTISQRDAELRGLLSNANKATSVLGNRTNQIVGLIRDSNQLLAALRTQSSALGTISGNISALSRQLHGFIGENRDTLKPAVEKLNGVVATLDNRKAELQEGIKGLSTYALTFGESVSGGPFFKAYVGNLLPGQFVQPFVDAAFSDLGLDPNVLLPSQRTDPQIGQPGTPGLPLPFPRTGQGGPPNRTLPDAITGNPGDPRYPYRAPLPAPPPGGPPPGPPALAPGQTAVQTPTPSPVFQPAPGEPGSSSTQPGAKAAKP